MTETVNALAVEIAKLRLTMEQQGEILERLDHHVRGNGAPGLTMRTDRIERTLAHIEDTNKKRWQIILGIMSSVTAAVIIKWVTA